jgi:hypothetical protein
MVIKKLKVEPDGSPLAVCVNDCEIDYGQPYAELAPVCFQVGCAFAERRWAGLGLAKSALIMLQTSKTRHDSGSTKQC